MKTAAALVAFAAVASTASFAQADDVAYWSFSNQALPGGGFGFFADEFPFAAEFGDQEGQATIELVGGILDELDVTSGGDEVLRWVQSFSGTDLGAQFGEPSGGSLAIQGGTDTLNNGSQIVINFDGSNLTNLFFEFDARNTSSGFQDVTIDLFDGGTFVSTIEAGLVLSTSFASFDYDISALDGVADARIVFTLNGATGTSGNIRTDNFYITGDAGTGGCRADLDGDGSLTIFDFLQFQNLFDSGDLTADFDGDGSLTLFDFLAFQNEFDAGC
ncbi:MAG: GC-type dockerin domain-anchored protein [Phycisphaerales bacterium JB064]